MIAHCDYGYTSDLSLQAMLDDDVLVAWAHGGEPLTGEHGFPLRLVVPKRYAWKSAKWLRGPRVLGAEQARLLGGARLPHPRRAVGRGALLVPGRPARRARAVADRYSCEAARSLASWMTWSAVSRSRKPSVSVAWSSRSL